MFSYGGIKVFCQMASVESVDRGLIQSFIPSTVLSFSSLLLRSVFEGKNTF